VRNCTDDYWKKRGVTVWEPSKVSPDAKIGLAVNVGSFTEISGRVEIGDNVRIGAMCFIPEGVTIEDDAWVGPRCTFTNDRFPPSPHEKWQKTTVKCGARLGAGVTVVCGVTIGAKALIGAGSVVTKNVPPGETWAGVPAEPLVKKARKPRKKVKGGK
jgi:UDP-2-acetamido-3-amino-2,3-dideoxy-glucuronate N-acetyltransferase